MHSSDNKTMKCIDCKREYTLDELNKLGSKRNSMNAIKVGFITPDMTKSEPRWLELPAVPRIGDHVTLDTGCLYRVAHVHWSYTSTGFKCIEVHLSGSVDTSFPVS